MYYNNSHFRVYHAWFLFAVLGVSLLCIDLRQELSSCLLAVALWDVLSPSEREMANMGQHGLVGWWDSGSDWCWWMLVEMGMTTVLTRIKKQPATTTTTAASSMNSVPGLFVVYVHIPTHLWTSLKETGMVMTSFKYVDVSYRRASLFAMSLVCKMLGQQVKQIWFWEW